MRRLFNLILFVVLLTGFQIGCKEKSASLSTPPTTNDPAVVMVTDELLKRLKITSIEEGDFIETLRLPARVELDEQRLTRIGATVTGRVSQIHATLGQRVDPGQLMATLHSAELSVAQLALFKALSQSELQIRAVDRAKQLFASDVIGAAELQKRESELAQAQAELQAAYGQLSVLGMTEKEIQKIVSTRTVHSFSSITATQKGVVIERKITPGQVVQPGGALFTVADLSHVWLVAEAPEQQAVLINKGEVAQAEIPALKGKRIEGRLIYVADTVNPERRTVTVRMDVENPSGQLKPEMLASMVIRGASQRRLQIPAVAVIRENNKDHVFVRLNEKSFRLHPVILGPENNGYFPVQSGLKSGEPIITEGAFHLNNERKRKELEG